jgi:ATP-binding cassette subfamily B protein
VAFNRLDYFRTKFAEVNEANYKSSVSAGLASNILAPLYGAAANFAQLFVLAYGVLLITSGQMTVGLLIGFFLYLNSFYQPLRQLAALWSSLQLALASLDRVSEVLELSSDMLPVTAGEDAAHPSRLAFDHVSFMYPEGKQVLGDVSFTLEAGKTYALVGPTGGGKTTTASIMARLYDPTSGVVTLDGRDIRSYTPAERTKKIGFILQEPFLFTGTVGENIVYGNDEYAGKSTAELDAVIKTAGLEKLIARFDAGLDTKIGTGEGISLGQKQLVAFMRAVLRKPAILILDEATANIDTVTEQLLEEVLEKLPQETTRVIIAHRLNTIKNADDIFFVNGGEVQQAGSFERAIDLLMHGKRQS